MKQNKITLFIFFLLVSSSPALAEVNRSSQYLAEYGIQCYERGVVSDAIHELKKALIADPENCVAREFLKKIFRELGPTLVSSVVPSRACIGERLIFDAGIAYENTFQDLIYAWDFGDGTSQQGRRLAKVYKKGARFKVRLVISDSCGSETFNFKIKVNTPPTVDAGSDVYMCVGFGEEFRVSFSADAKDADGDRLEYTWDFGDGEVVSSKLSSVTHLYKRAGSYIARVMVNDGSGLGCSSSEDTLQVQLHRQPKAEAGEDIISCTDRETIFDGSRSRVEEGSNPTYIWDFGDGTSAKGKRVRHIYKKSGSYKVTLTVDDGENTICSGSTDSLKVNINAAPAANLLKLEPSCTGNYIEFNAYYSSDPDNDPLRYIWDFGDGTVVEGKSYLVTHAYKKSGDYLVRLTIDDGRNSPCSKNTTTTAVSIIMPQQADAGRDISACPQTEIEFDGSASAETDELLYKWDFGDGYFAQGIKVVHAYAQPGTYEAALSVDHASGMFCARCTDKKTVKVVTPPFIRKKDKNIEMCFSPKEEYNVKFDFLEIPDTNGNNITYNWDFGDGTSAAGKSATHTYKNSGVYDAKLTIDNGLGLPCSLATGTVRLTLNRPPVLGTVQDTSYCLGAESLFNAVSAYDPDADRLSYEWDFGDGTGAQGVMASHEYKKSGIYNVKLRVDDNSSTQCSGCAVTFRARVNEKPVSIIKVKVPAK